MADPFLAKPRRMFRGTGAAGAFTNNFAGVFNNSTSAELIVIWDWSLSAVAAFTAASFLNQGVIGVAGMAGIPVLTGEAAGPGVIYTGGNPATRVLDYLVGGSGTSSINWHARLPFAVIHPGWTFGFSTGANNIAFTASFLWQAIVPDELLPDRG